MPYIAEISRAHPTLFVFLLDQSRSMSEQFGDSHQSKAEFVADVVNRTVHDLVIRATRTEQVRDYYHVAAIGYGRSIGSLLTGLPEQERLYARISEIAEKPIRIESRTKRSAYGDGQLKDHQIKFPVWIEPTAAGWTHMCGGLTLVGHVVKKWLTEHYDSFPPTILHLTDGASTDGDPTQVGADILAQSTSDGHVLLFNCHVSARYSIKIEYPQNSASLPDGRARTLFNLSSVIPEAFVRSANQVGLSIAHGARGFVFNGDPVAVAQFFEVGTRPANLR